MKLTKKYERIFNLGSKIMFCSLIVMIITSCSCFFITFLAEKPLMIIQAMNLLLIFLSFIALIGAVAMDIALSRGLEMNIIIKSVIMATLFTVGGYLGTFINMPLVLPPNQNNPIYYLPFFVGIFGCWYIVFSLPEILEGLS